MSNGLGTTGSEDSKSTNWLGWITAGLGALNVWNWFSTSKERKKREKKQVGAIQEQYEAVAGRTEDIEAFYESLTEFGQQETELERQDVSRDFFGKALGLGQERKERIRSSGMAQTGTSDINLAEIIAGRDIKKSFAGIEQGRQGELLKIGKARELELQGIEDLLFGLETEAIGRGGKIKSSGNGSAYDSETAYAAYVEAVNSGRFEVIENYEPGWLVDWWEDNPGLR